eukprot:scaffold652038_cov51-Prasinocladus_malaysianus.AAC.1
MSCLLSSSGMESMRPTTRWAAPVALVRLFICTGDVAQRPMRQDICLLIETDDIAKCKISPVPG